MGPIVGQKVFGEIRQIGSKLMFIKSASISQEEILGGLSSMVGIILKVVVWRILASLIRKGKFGLIQYFVSIEEDIIISRVDWSR